MTTLTTPILTVCLMASFADSDKHEHARQKYTSQITAQGQQGANPTTLLSRTN